MNYFEHREEMKRLATNHHMIMEEKLDSYTRYSISNAIMYRDNIPKLKDEIFLSSEPSIVI